MQERLTAFVRGSVQGVGFRWWVRSHALALGLEGSARNLDDGRVEVVAQGERDVLERFLASLGPESVPSDRPGYVVGVVPQWAASKPATGRFR